MKNGHGMFLYSNKFDKSFNWYRMSPSVSVLVADPISLQLKGKRESYKICEWFSMLLISRKKINRIYRIFSKLGCSGRVNSDLETFNRLQSKLISLIANSKQKFSSKIDTKLSETCWSVLETDKGYIEFIVDIIKISLFQTRSLNFQFFLASQCSLFSNFYVKPK